LLDEFEPSATIVIIDAAIGLPERGIRKCDDAARECLNSPREDSHIAAPCRPTLKTLTFDEAVRANRKLRGFPISIQGFAQFGRIREVDDWITPERQEWVREGHPELAFARLSPDEQAILYSKKSATGERLRLDLLRKFGFRLDLDAVREDLGPKKVSRDEIIDATACLTIAHMAARSDILVLPEDGAEFDARGLRMEIVT